MESRELVHKLPDLLSDFPEPPEFCPFDAMDKA
jgi:hypothetical protein